MRYEYNGTVEDDLIFYLLLPINTVVEEIFSYLDTFMRQNNIDWFKRIRITIDGVCVMSIHHLGLMA